MTKPHVDCNLKQILEKKGVKQEQLAEELEIDPATLSRIARGHRNPRVTLALRIARQLAVDARDIWPTAKFKRRK